MKVVERKISELIPAEYNPRYLSEDAEAHLKASLKRFGAVDPAIINTHPDRKDIIIGGHQRLKVWKSMGNDTFPCVEVELDRDKERELNIRLNKNTGAFDWDLLANYFEVEELTDWGFTDDELFGDDMFEEPEAEEDDYEVPDEIETDIVLGDLIEIGQHRLLCGDSTDSGALDKLTQGESFNLVVTDPPYNVDYTGKTKDALKIKNDRQSQDDFYQFLYDFFVTTNIRVLAGASYYVWHADSEGHNFRRAMIDAGIPVRQCLIWAKNSMVMGRQDYHWQHEPCLYGWKEGASHNWYADRKQTTILEFDRPNRSAEHPTMKPVPLISYLMKNSSKADDLIYDGFLGSGTTMVACHQLDRTCYGMELDPKYCQVIIDRMITLDPSLEVKVNGKEYESKSD